MWEIAITEKETDVLLLEILKNHHTSIKLDTEVFFDLLKHSLSLNTMEKKRVFDAVPTLSQFQFDELTKVFEDERVKFKELAKKHPEDIKKLLTKQQKEWLELGDIYKTEAEAKAREWENEAKIDDIKSQLGL